MKITHSDAMAFLMLQVRENERAASLARERGGSDFAAETRAIQFKAIADLLAEQQKIAA